MMLSLLFCLFLFFVHFELSKLSSSNTTYPWIKKVPFVSMTHIDVSFTNFAANVCSLYFNEHLPNAARRAQELRDRGGAERFIFTTHAWLLLEFFDNIAQCLFQ
jgi:Mg2+ and Co2+ transporter CorA